MDRCSARKVHGPYVVSVLMVKLTVWRRGVPSSGMRRWWRRFWCSVEREGRRPMRFQRLVVLGRPAERTCIDEECHSSHLLRWVRGERTGHWDAHCRFFFGLAARRYAIHCMAMYQLGNSAASDVVCFFRVLEFFYRSRYERGG